MNDEPQNDSVLNNSVIDEKIFENRMPQVSFSTFVLSLASSALVQLGEVPDPGTEQISEDLIMARHTIDILSMLQNKTRECLDHDESRLLEGILYDLRMKYVIKSKK